jgi:hypothetical protein
MQFEPPAGSNLYHQEVTITNRSGSAISGPLYYVLMGLPTPSGAGLTSGAGVTRCFPSTNNLGNEIVLISAGGLVSGQFIKFGLDFVDAAGLPNYTPKVLSGAPSK